MRIYVRAPEGPNFWLAFPTGMLLNPLTAKIVEKVLREKTGEKAALVCSIVNQRNLSSLFRELRRIKRKYPGMELVEVESKDGTRVKIKL